jgi:hypothetical protein
MRKQSVEDLSVVREGLLKAGVIEQETTGLDADGLIKSLGF